MKYATFRRGINGDGASKSKKKSLSVLLTEYIQKEFCGEKRYSCGEKRYSCGEKRYSCPIPV